MASTLPSAKELMAKAAEKEAQKAAEAMRLQAKADAEEGLDRALAAARASPMKKHCGASR